IFGMWLDYILDQVRIIICVCCLFGAQYLATHNAWFLVVGAGVLTLDLFHYVNSQEIFQINTQMRTRLNAARTQAGGWGGGGAGGREEGAGHRSVEGAAGRGGCGAFRKDPRPLARRPDRPHLVGGIEFQMAVLIIAPLTGWIIAVSVVAGALMIVFELAV